MFTWLRATWDYFYQVISLAPKPVTWFVNNYRTDLVSLLEWLLTNPFFYAIIGIILLMSILPKFED